MFFNNKNKKEKKCEACGKKSSEKYSFCPHCGNDLVDYGQERIDYGLLGREDADYEEQMPAQGFGVMDKLVNSMLNSMMKNFDRQFKNQLKDAGREGDRTEIKTFPNGIKIKISGPLGADIQKRKVTRPQENVGRREISALQLKKMNSLPKIQAKTSVKRLGDKVVYELTTPGVNSADNVFVSKLENGYEIKAIGEKKIYVNSVPINLPLKKYSILKNKLSMEFVDLNARVGQEAG